MKLKSSYKFPFLFISVLLLLVLTMLYLSSNPKKTDKYPSPPIGEIQKTSLDLIQISVNEKSFKKLKKKRDKALSIGVLQTSDSDYVPATVTFNGIDYPAEIRLKGDWTIHLEGIKWSFRVKLKGDKTILGMRKFSLHHPSTRQYLNEWMYHNAMKRENLMGLRYHFVEGKIHIKTSGNKYVNKDVGIYAVEETFDKRTIESNKRKESIILKFSEDNWWREVIKSKEIADSYGKDYSEFMNGDLLNRADLNISVFSESKTLEDSTLRNYFKTGKNLLNDLSNRRIYISEAFDVKKLAMDVALTNLFGAIHGTYRINMRYYYNPIISKLEPISFDGNSGVKLKAFKKFTFQGKGPDTLYLKELAKALYKVGQPEYVDNLVKANKSSLEYYEKVLKTEFKGKLFNEDNLRFNQNIIRQELKKLTKELSLNDLVYDSIELPEKLLKPTTFDLTNVLNWNNRDINLTNTNKKYKNQQIFEVARTTVTKAAFLRQGRFSVTYGTEKEVSVIVKKGTTGTIFGLRIQGSYPNRVDALFNLENGQVKDIYKEGYFDNEQAKIKPLGNDWFLCSIKARVNTDLISVVFGPTDDSKKALNWEGPTKAKVNTFIIPESLTLKEE